MGIAYSDLQRQKNTSAWTVTGGVHVTTLFPTLGDVSGRNQPPAPFYLFEEDNNGNTKIMSRPMPEEGQNPNITTLWQCWFQFPSTVGVSDLYFIIANQQNLDISDANIRGYACFAAPTANIIRIARLNGGGGMTILGAGYNWNPADTNLHSMAMTREVSGANRFWRLYFDGAFVEVTASDATYTDFGWWGFYYATGGATRRIIFGGEMCQS